MIDFLIRGKLARLDPDVYQLIQIETLPPAGQEQAERACAQMAEGLWNALSGIYGEECMPG